MLQEIVAHNLGTEYGHAFDQLVKGVAIAHADHLFSSSAARAPHQAVFPIDGFAVSRHLARPGMTTDIGPIEDKEGRACCDASQDQHFSKNHVSQLASVDFFTVHTIEIFVRLYRPRSRSTTFCPLSTSQLIRRRNERRTNLGSLSVRYLGFMQTR
jgi:hypothetical protein